jgi:hypothetical protein
LNHPDRVDSLMTYVIYDYCTSFYLLFVAIFLSYLAKDNLDNVYIWSFTVFNAIEYQWFI